MLKINNEKARGELIQNPKCQPVLQHFGRGSPGKTGWRYLLYGLQLVCQCSHTSAICFSQTSGTKQFPRCWIWAGSLGAHTSGLRGSTWLPHSCRIPPVCTPQSLLRSAWAALLGFSSDTHILVTITSVSAYVGKLSTLQSTTLPVHRVSRNV